MTFFPSTSAIALTLSDYSENTKDLLSTEDDVGRIGLFAMLKIYKLEKNNEQYKCDYFEHLWT